MANADPFCPFCHLDAGRLVACNELALAFRDRFPVSPGHMLIVPRRHIGDYFEATEAENLAIHRLLHDIRDQLARELKPDGYNIGINSGLAAGQTVMHLHVHLIPRYQGDRPEPRGGVRWIFPERACYWSNSL